MMVFEQYKEGDGSINKEQIKKIIPYDEPFLLIDKIVSLEKRRIVAEKFVDKEEQYLKGHFKGFPIMPGALIVEGLGQAATLMVRANLMDHEKYDVLAYKIKNAKFFRPIFPGHTLRFEAKLFFRFKIAWFVKGRVYRNDKLVAKVSMVLAVVDREKFRNRK